MNVGIMYLEAIQIVKKKKELPPVNWRQFFYLYVNKN